MDIVGFQRELDKRAIGPGAHWSKADFHIHLPGSSDYEYKQPDAFERLGEALRATNRAFAVVLKHQEFPTREEIQKLQAHCPETLLIPGAEINIIVDALFKKIGKDYFCHCIVAVDPAQEGDYSFVLRKAQEQYSYRPGDYPAGFRSSILDLGKFFRENNALFIPAHLHQSKSAENSRSIDDLYEDDAFLDFVAAGAFDALEVRQQSTATFFDGEHKTTDGRPIPASVCVASTDAHHHDHILQRQRATWVRVQKPSFDELVAALRFPHRVSLNEPSPSHARILGIHVVGTFVQEAWIAFNEGLNAFIGSKGSGKTALLECLRFLHNTPVPSERAADVKRHIEHILGSSGYVECLVQKDDGTRFLITRRADSPDRISILDQRGQARTVNAANHRDFPISVLGWHEIEALADKPAARIAILDRIGDSSVVNRHQQAIKEQVEKARDLLPSLQRQIKKLDGSLRHLWDLQHKRSTLARLQQADLLALQEQYEWYLSVEQKLVGLDDAVSRRLTAIPDAVSSRLAIELPTPPETESIRDAVALLAKMSDALAENKSHEDQVQVDLQEKLSRLSQELEESRRKLTVSFTTFRDNIYTPQVNALPPDEREILTSQILVLEETKQLPLIERSCTELLDEVKKSAHDLALCCAVVCDQRDAIVAHRQQLVADLNDDLPNVKLQFRRSVNHEARDRFQNRFGEDASALNTYVRGFGNSEGYQNLRALFEQLSQLEITEGSWQINRILWNIAFVEFLDVLDDDDVEISLEVGRAGYVPIHNLSAGQRCVAVFPLLLRNSRGPLVIDQPEDNLDNRYIADTIAPDLLNRKRNQQFVLTSHNANLVVLTDADLIMHIDSDGTTCSYPAAGFLSCASSQVKKSVLDVLDGGERALEARHRKYGLQS